MFAAQRLESLAGRKQLLVAQAELQRHLIALEWAGIAERVRGLAPAVGAARVWQAWRTYGWLAAPVAGFMATRRWRPLLRWAWRGVILWRTFRSQPWFCDLRAER
jgi:hypothetical protein